MTTTPNDRPSDTPSGRAPTRVLLVLDQPIVAELVKLTLNRSLVDKLHLDIAEAIETLEKKGPVSKSERRLVKTSVSH